MFVSMAIILSLRISDSVTTLYTSEDGGEFVVKLAYSAALFGDKATPMSLAPAPDGRLFTAMKQGKVFVSEPGTAPTLILDLTDHHLGINSKKERGLLSMILDPKFAQNGFFYIYWSTGIGRTFRVSRFKFKSETVVQFSSELVIWTDTDEATNCCHFGGGMAFGPDGLLWLATGDKFEGAAVSQNSSRAGGALHRFSSDGSLPPTDNLGMSDGVGGAMIDTIYATGLRNPLKMSWFGDRLLIAEVGGNDHLTAWEDVHVGNQPGKNFGWPMCEGPCSSVSDGTRDFPTCDCALHDNPIYAYKHSEKSVGRASITGGVVVKPGGVPASVGIDGKYLFGDWVKNRLYVVDLGATPVAGMDYPARTSIIDVNAPLSIVQFPSGEIYVGSYSGDIFHLTYQRTGEAPPDQQSFKAITSTSGMAPLTVKFSAKFESIQPLKEVVWAFDDGEVSRGSALTTEHTFKKDGVYHVSVSAENAFGGSQSKKLITVEVGTPPKAVIEAPVANDRTFVAGDIINFAAASEVGCVSTWSVTLNHAGHLHPVIEAYNGDDFSLEIETNGHSYSDDVHYEVTLKVTAANGLAASTTINLYPRKVDIDIVAVIAGTDRIIPEGIAVVIIDGIPTVMPTVLDTLIHFQHEIGVSSSTICVDGNELEFIGWELDGHLLEGKILKVPEADAVLTSRFAPTDGHCVSGARGLAQKVALEGLNAGGTALDAVIIDEGECETVNNIDIVSSSDLGRVVVQSYIQCAELCLRDPKCYFASFVGGACYTKAGYTKVKISKGVTGISCYRSAVIPTASPTTTASLPATTTITPERITTGVCKEWCADYNAPWEKVCAFKNCGGCDLCAQASTSTITVATPFKHVTFQTNDGLSTVKTFHLSGSPQSSVSTSLTMTWTLESASSKDRAKVAAAVEEIVSPFEVAELKITSSTVAATIRFAEIEQVPYHIARRSRSAPTALVLSTPVDPSSTALAAGSISVLAVIIVVIVIRYRKHPAPTDSDC